MNDNDNTLGKTLDEFERGPVADRVARTELKTRITGTKFRGAEAIQALGMIEKGERLQLRRDPQNRYDSNAIEVRRLGVMIGFIPKVDNWKPAAAMDAGQEVLCTCLNNAIVDNGKVVAEPIVILCW